jgi:UDPglucose 6-dehydrogenase
VIEVNDRQRERMVEKIARGGGRRSRRGSTVAMLGLSFKPETDDMRDAPSIDVIRELQERGATVRAYDPVAMENAARDLPGSNVTVQERVRGLRERRRPGAR